jgi:2-polyprenyl-3-methyl-5-hydroxy-6-metoxy-1,4-benzoquinol methylase
VSTRDWNHNIHYHEFVLDAVPPACQRALDVGCGQGLLAQRLARHSQEVIAIDVDRDAITHAQAAHASGARIEFVEGDALTHPFPENSFDFIGAVAALHHLPLRPALVRFRSLLRPGGVLVVIGLHRSHTPVDYAWSAAAFPVSWMFRCLRHQVEVGAPVQNPRESLGEIRSACDAVLPGAALRRRLLFRYSLIWRKL